MGQWIIGTPPRECHGLSYVYHGRIRGAGPADNSLGFQMITAEEGVGLYGGLGTFYDTIEMSSRGLLASGSFDFLSSTTWSDNFLFHPDSLMARSTNYLLREVVGMAEFPYVENTVADITLYPEEEVMHLAKVEENFKVFSDSVRHSGDLDLRPPACQDRV